MSELDELVAEAEIGDEARRFVESDLGKCVLGMAEQEAVMAQEKLSDIDPTKIEEVRKLQNVVWRARQFEDWLTELISRGENAMEVYKHGTQKQ